MEVVDVTLPFEPSRPIEFIGVGVPTESADHTADLSSRRTADVALAEAFAALDRGDSTGARGLAHSVLIASRAASNELDEANALGCLAHCDRVAQRPRRAADTGRRSVHLFQRLGNVAGESQALNTVAYASMLLGRTDEALEAALLSVRLSEVDGATLPAVQAFNCLGMSYCWSGAYDKADASLETAIRLASACNPPTSSYQPKLNQLFVEAMRLAEARFQTSALPSLKRMHALVRECRQLERSGAELKFMPGMLPVAQTISLVMKLLWAAWQGNEENAQIYADRAVGSLGGAVTWLDALVRWGLAEVAWAREEWSVVEVNLTEMKSCATTVEHEGLACHAHLLLIQVYELQGKTGLAMLEGRSLRSREQRISFDGIVSRENAVKWQLGARQSERHLEQALLASKQFERWSLEDALTGIANRRAFEAALSERLPGAVGSGRPLTVAMIDIDQFKQINDGYSHQVGDRVLKALATLLVGSVREHDLAARLAGDEFIVLLSDAGTAEANEIVMRIEHAVSSFRWEAIAPGLSVSLSIGLSHAVAGDTVESIVHRSDSSMYSKKTMPRWEPTRI